VIAACVLAAPAARAQDDKQELKKKLLDEISKKLDEEMKRILDEMGKLIDEEIAKFRGRKPDAPPANPGGAPGFLGVQQDPDQPDEDDFKAWKVEGGARISVIEGGPAEKSGLKDGDVITEVEGTKVREWAELPESLKGRKAGEKVKVKIIRGKEAQEVTVTLGKRQERPADAPPAPPPANPPKAEGKPGRLGISPGDATGKGMAIDSVSAGTPAAEAGIKAGDVLTKLNDTAIWKESDLEAFMKKSKAGMKVEVTVLRAGEEKRFSVVLAER